MKNKFINLISSVFSNFGKTFTRMSNRLSSRIATQYGFDNFLVFYKEFKEKCIKNKQTPYIKDLFFAPELSKITASENMRNLVKSIELGFIEQENNNVLIHENLTPYKEVLEKMLDNPNQNPLDLVENTHYLPSLTGEGINHINTVRKSNNRARRTAIVAWTGLIISVLPYLIDFFTYIQSLFSPQSLK